MTDACFDNRYSRLFETVRNFLTQRLRNFLGMAAESDALAFVWLLGIRR